MLDVIETGENLTDAQMRFHNKNKTRDLALVTLLSEPESVYLNVSLDIEDIDFKNCGIKIVRKGGYEAVVYFFRMKLNLFFQII